MKYIVYKTTNKINNKIYIGVHKTENPDIFDGYIGNGIDKATNYFIKHPVCVFHYAVHKYGYNNFTRETLYIFSELKEALIKEAELVDINFIKREDTYNVALGGACGKTYYPINQFDLQSNLIYTWDNMVEASRALCVSHTSINNAKLHKGSCLGYFWSTDSKIVVSEFTYHIGTPVYKYNSDGILIEQFSSVTEAAKNVDSKENAIFRAIKMNMRHRNYYWSFELTSKYVPKTIALKDKTLYLYSLEGTFIRSLLIGKETKEFFNICSYGCLKEALLNNRPYKGYQIYLEKKNNVEATAEYSNNKAKKVVKYSLNGEMLETYNSVKEATKIYGSGVFRVLNNQQKSTKGFIFKYL